MTHPDVFCLTDENGRPLLPSVQATVLAKYSRSPDSARDLLSKLTVEEADKFQDKYVISYGHNSVAELASVPVCFEGISIVASKCIEQWQRAAYSEKSTRYQVFNRDSFVTPPGAPSTMKSFAARFYNTYERLMEPMAAICAEKMGKDPREPKALQDRLVKARAFDNLRYLLPAGTGTNVAVTANIRDLRDMIKHLRGEANPEFQVLGNKLCDAVQQVAPALVKHTEADTFEPTIISLGSLGSSFSPHKNDWHVSLYNQELMPSSHRAQYALEGAIRDRHMMDWPTFCRYMQNRTEHQEVPKVFKMLPISFEIMMDYGAFRDLQRHRRCEQFVEPLSTNYGYLVPDDIIGSEIESEYRMAMEAIDAYDDECVIHDQNLFQYMVPLGYLHRSIFQMDVRELYYISELRTKPQGHISYRRIAYEMYRLGSLWYPEAMQFCRAIKPDAIGVHN